MQTSNAPSPCTFNYESRIEGICFGGGEGIFTCPLTSWIPPYPAELRPVFSVKGSGFGSSISKKFWIWSRILDTDPKPDPEVPKKIKNVKKINF
jgi:hypothetical protein